MRNSVLTLSFLFFFQLAYSQEVFTVIISQNAYTIIPSVETKPLMAGRKLLPSEKIKIDSGGYLGLLHVIGKTIELTNPGIYSLDSLSNLFTKTDNTVSVKAHPLLRNAIVAEYPKYKNLNATSSQDQHPQDIVNCPDQVMVYPDMIYLSWKKYEKRSYQVKLFNIYDEEVFAGNTESNSIKIDLNTLNPNELDEHFVKLNIYSAEEKKTWTPLTTDHYLLTFAEDSILQKTKTELEIIKKALPEQSALNYFIIGLYYEKKNLLLNALYYYHEAATSDYNLIYLKEYMKFLKRYDINKSGSRN